MLFIHVCSTHTERANVRITYKWMLVCGIVVTIIRRWFQVTIILFTDDYTLQRSIILHTRDIVDLYDQINVVPLLLQRDSIKLNSLRKNYLFNYVVPHSFEATSHSFLVLHILIHTEHLYASLVVTSV